MGIQTQTMSGPAIGFHPTNILIARLSLRVGESTAQEDELEVPFADEARFSVLPPPVRDASEERRSPSDSTLRLEGLPTILTGRRRG